MSSIPYDKNLFYASTKTYCHNIGLSCCFRQWRAKSHCRFLHGYALEVKLTFWATTLDENNWVQDFGGLKPIKKWLEDNFDHKLLVAEDDPCLEFIRSFSGTRGTYLHTVDEHKIADVRVVKATGCEAFARMIYDYVSQWMIEQDNEDSWRVKLVGVEVREHAANSAYVGLRAYPGSEG